MRFQGPEADRMNAIYTSLTPCVRPGRWIARPVKLGAVRLACRLHDRKGGVMKRAVEASAYVYNVAPGSLMGWMKEHRDGNL